MDAKDGPRYFVRGNFGAHIREQTADLLKACADADLIITHPAAMGGAVGRAQVKQKMVVERFSADFAVERNRRGYSADRAIFGFYARFGPAVGEVLLRNGQNGHEQMDRARRTIARRNGFGRRASDVRGPIFAVRQSALFFAAISRRRNAIGPPTQQPPASASTTPTATKTNSTKTTIGVTGRYQGAAPIVFTLGSSAVYDAGDFWHRSAEYATRLQHARHFTDRRTDQHRLARQHFGSRLRAAFGNFPAREFNRASRRRGHNRASAARRSAANRDALRPRPTRQRARLRRLGVALDESKKCYPGEAFEWMMDDYPKFARRASELGEKIRAENGPQAACEAMERVGQ